MRKFLKDLSIRYKILIPVGILGCLMFILGVVSFTSTVRFRERCGEKEDAGGRGEFLKTGDQ